MTKLMMYCTQLIHHMKNIKKYIKKNKDVTNIQIIVKCYKKLSQFENEIIDHIVNNNYDCYMKELLLSTGDNNYKTKCVQFIKLVQNNIKKYGIDNDDCVFIYGTFNPRVVVM